MTVGNSTFNGNVGKDRGGAIAAFGQGYVDLTNCTFYGNEAFGASPDRRAGSGGAIYASPGMVVSVRTERKKGNSLRRGLHKRTKRQGRIFQRDAPLQPWRPVRNVDRICWKDLEGDSALARQTTRIYLSPRRCDYTIDDEN